MVEYSLKKKFNFIFLFIFILHIQSKEIVNEYFLEGEVSTKYLDNIIDLHLVFNSHHTPLLIHFLPIDCGVIIVNEDEEQSMDIKKISNYNYDAYSVLINDTKTYLNINPLINSSKEQSYFKNYPLIINQIYFDDSGIPQLNVKENEPVFLYFNNALKLINLLYKFENNDIEYPIIVSFFIKEKIKFKVEISDGENNITNRIINYKENFIIKPKHNKIYNISITPNENGIIDSTMIVKIIHNNSIPFCLQRNQLNLGFIPKNIDFYYFNMKFSPINKTQ